MKVVFTSHRIENLPFLRKEFEDAEIIVLEEPRNDLLQKVLNGDISVESYLRFIDTPFPLYTKKLIEMLKEMKDKKILQIEPYLEEVERLREKNEGDERVRETERKVNLAYLDYVEAFMRRDFEKIIEKVIEFAKADAERFVVRDKMRAEAIDFDAVIEAGVMHTKLAEFLDAETVSIPELIGEKLGVEYLEPPGNILTKSFIYGFDCDEELLAARSLIYVTLTKKEELSPNDLEFPHFIYEQKLIRFVNKLDYEKCRRLFFKLWKFEED